MLAAILAVVAGTYWTSLPASAEPESPAAVAPDAGVAHRPAVEAGQALLRQAIVALEAREALSARIRFHAGPSGRRALVGSGAFAEQQSDRGQLFRLELKLHVDDRRITLLELFDGETLWTFDDLDGERLTSVDVAEVARFLADQGNLPRIGQIGTWPGLGGMHRLLRGLHAAFDFELVEQKPFYAIDVGADHELPVWRLCGTWKKGVLAEILGEKEEAVDLSRQDVYESVPERLPRCVEVFLGKDDLFPYRIAYLRTKAAAVQEQGPAEADSILTIEFPEVDFSPSFPEATFTYVPGDLTARDTTKRFLDRLK